MAVLSVLAPGLSAPVLSASLRLPGCGAWVAEVELEEQVTAAGSVTLRVESGAERVDFTGALAVGLAQGGRRRAYLVGGAGRLGSPVSGLYYQGVPARLVAQDLLREVGETLSVASSGLDVLLSRWTRLPGTAGRALGDLSSALGLRWTLSPGGEVLTSPESAPPIPFPGPVEVLSVDGLGRSLELDLPLPTLAPGHSLPAGEIGRVVYTFTGRGARATAWLCGGVL